MALFRGEGFGSLPKSEIVSVSLAATPLSNFIYIAARPQIVRAIRVQVNVVGAGGSTLKVRKITDSTSLAGAAAGATVLEMITAVDLTVVAPVQTVPLLSNNVLAAGDKIAFLMAVGTGVVGILQVEIEEGPQ